MCGILILSTGLRENDKGVFKFHIYLSINLSIYLSIYQFSGSAMLIIESLYLQSIFNQLKKNLEL